jgi:hypothetical protein
MKNRNLPKPTMLNIHQAVEENIESVVNISTTLYPFLRNMKMNDTGSFNESDMHRVNTQLSEIVEKLTNISRPFLDEDTPGDFRDQAAWDHHERKK